MHRESTRPAGRPIEERRPLDIWLVTVGEPLPLPQSTDRRWRTGLVAAELARRGHAVTWWTSRFDHINKTRFQCAEPEFAAAPGLTIRFLDGIGYRRNISITRLINHWQIARAFRHAAERAPPPAVIVCSYPTIELGDEAVAYGHERRVPVVLDIRDLWPDIFLDAAPAGTRLVARILLQSLYRRSSRALGGATALFAVSPGYLEWGLARARRGRRDHDAMFPLAYEQLPTDAQGDRALEQRLGPARLAQAKRIAVFVGTFGRTYDVSTVIGAARLLRDRSDIEFVICGRGEREAEWRAEAQGLANVVFPGWLSAQEINALLARSWVGLAAYERGAPQGIPNKVVEYLSAGLPVLCSLGGETDQLLARTECGLTYAPGSPEDLATKLTELGADVSRRDSMAAAARQVFDRYFSSTTVYSEMSTRIEEIAGQSATPTFASVTETPGEPITRTQLQRLHHRYSWAAAHGESVDVVEVGCGYGPGLGLLGRRAKSLIAGDIVPSMVERARRHYGDRLEVRVIDAQSLPFAPGSVDVVVLFEALYYLPDPDAFVAECRRVLRPGGGVLVATANKDLWDFHRSAHSHQYLGVLELRELFQRHGFATRFFGYEPVDSGSRWLRMLRPVKKLADTLGLIPGSLAGRMLLKRLVFGRPIPMPDEVAADACAYEPPVAIPGDAPDRRHRIIYCEARLG